MSTPIPPHGRLQNLGANNSVIQPALSTADKPLHLTQNDQILALSVRLQNIIHITTNITMQEIYTTPSHTI